MSHPILSNCFVLGKEMVTINDILMYVRPCQCFESRHPHDQPAMPRCTNRCILKTAGRMHCLPRGEYQVACKAGPLQVVCIKGQSHVDVTDGEGKETK